MWIMWTFFFFVSQILLYFFWSQKCVYWNLLLLPIHGVRGLVNYGKEFQFNLGFLRLKCKICFVLDSDLSTLIGHPLLTVTVVGCGDTEEMAQFPRSAGFLSALGNRQDDLYLTVKPRTLSSLNVHTLSPQCLEQYQTQGRCSWNQLMIIMQSHPGHCSIWDAF